MAKRIFMYRIWNGQRRTVVIILSRLDDVCIIAFTLLSLFLSLNLSLSLPLLLDRIIFITFEWLLYSPGMQGCRNGQDDQTNSQYWISCNIFQTDRHGGDYGWYFGEKREILSLLSCLFVYMTSAVSKGISNYINISICLT